MRWSISEIADLVVSRLEVQSQADDLGQVIYGFDTGNELRLHPLIQEALRGGGWGVWPEQRYPSDALRPRRSEGRRCDVVLTRCQLPIRDPLIKDTLFDHQPAADPQQAYWLEIKTVAQFETRGPFRHYSSELLVSVAEDVRKIWCDSLVRHGGLMLVLFTQQQTVAEHDLQIWHQRCLDRGFPVSPPAVRGFKITDRIGNAWCAVALFGVCGV